MNIQDDIIKAQCEQVLRVAEATGQTELIEKAIDFVIDSENEMEKGIKANVGEVREWKGGKYQKTPRGWKPVSKKYGESKFRSFTEDFVDEDTGEKVSLDRHVQVHSEQKRLDMIKKFKALHSEYDKEFEKFNALKEAKENLYDEVSDYNRQLKSLNKELAGLFSDQEQAIPQARGISDEEADKVANEFGGQMNDIEEKIEKLKSDMDLERKKEQIEKLDTASFEHQEKYWLLSSKMDNLRRDYAKAEFE